MNIALLIQSKRQHQDTKLLPAITLTTIVLSILITDGIVVNDISVKLNFSQVPKEFTCLGKNTSPEIGLSGVNAESLALILDDPDTPRGTFTHWIIWNLNPISIIPKSIPNVPSLKDPIEAVQGVNSGGKIGYMGPCPPPGKPHRYFFRVFGLDAPIDLKAGSNRSQLEKAMNGHILQQGEAMATFST
jgi:Raf kinase inhibitor-like YbhB/YbcL family protein